MFRKRCARSSDAVVQHIHIERRTRDCLIFVLALAAVIAAPHPACAGSSSADPAVLADPPFVSAASGETLPKLAATIPRLQKATTQIIVSISVNTEPKGDYFLELDEDGQLYIKIDDLLILKLGSDQGRAVLIHDDKFAPMSALRDVSYTFDEKKLTISILGKTTERRLTSIEVFPAQVRPQNVYYPLETSAFLNYGLT